MTFYYELDTISGKFYFKSKEHFESEVEATALLHEPVYRVTILTAFEFYVKRFFNELSYL